MKLFPHSPVFLSALFSRTMKLGYDTAVTIESIKDTACVYFPVAYNRQIRLAQFTQLLRLSVHCAAVDLWS
jgi:hypothetical protein